MIPPPKCTAYVPQAADTQTCGANNNEQCPYDPYTVSKLRCTTTDDLTTAAFFDTNGCDVLRGHILCSSSAGTAATNNGKCVQYTHDGRNCPQDRTHAIPLCGELDLIAGLTATQKASGGTHAAQGMVGFHFCQRSIKCYHPQANTVGSVIVKSNLPYADTRLPTPAENTGITDRCDDNAGAAGDEGDNKAGNKGNWRDHIFEAADPQYVNDGVDSNCAVDWWNNQPATIARPCTAAETAKGKTTCSDPNPEHSKSCVIHQLPSSNSYSPTAQCAHGVVPVDNCNGITFYFFIEKRGHNYKFNFCRHDHNGTPATAKTDGTGAHFDQYNTATPPAAVAGAHTGWGTAAKAGENQWKAR